MGSWLSTTSLVKQNNVILCRIEVLSIRRLTASTRTTMNYNYRSSFWVSTSFPIDLVNIRNLSKPSFICLYFWIKYFFYLRFSYCFLFFLRIRGISFLLLLFLYDFFNIRIDNSIKYFSVKWRFATTKF